MAPRCPRCGGFLQFVVDRTGRVLETCDSCPTRPRKHAPVRTAGRRRFAQIGEGNCLSCERPLSYAGKGPRDRYCNDCRAKVVKAKKRAYFQRPDVKAKKRAYSQRPDVKAKKRAYFQRPDVKAKKRAYFQRPDVKAKKRAYFQRPDVKAKMRAYFQRPDVKAKKRAYRQRPGPRCHRCDVELPRKRGRPPRLCSRCRRRA